MANESGTPEALNRVASNDSIGEISIDDLNLAEAQKEANQNRSKEFTKSPEGKDLLNRFHVFCIIANRMIGTGIFETPTAILHQDNNIGWSLIIWALGGVASMAGTLMYIEYGLTIPRRRLHGETRPVPRSGGELNYLNYLVKRPQFLATCVFGWVFILIGNSAANCISFGLHVLEVVRIKEPPSISVHAIAIVAAWIVFLFHALGRMFGVHLNSAFALVKVAILCMIIIMGLIVLINNTGSMQRDPLSYQNLSINTSFQDIESKEGNPAYGYASAYLRIVFTFGGWNQANYVLGEIEKPAKRFKSISLWSVGTISILYLLVNISYMIVVPIQRGGNFSKDTSVVKEFFRLTIGKAWNTNGAIQLWNACLAFSSLGNIIITTFTAARVKQEVAKEGILPWSLIFMKNVNLIEIVAQKFSSRSSRQNFEQDRASALAEAATTTSAKTHFEPIPLPALLLQCIVSTALILMTMKNENPEHAYNFLVGLYSYTIDSMVAVSLSLGLIYMRLRKSSPWNTYSESNRWFSLVTACIVFCSNSFPIALLWIHKSRGEFGKRIHWDVVPAMGWTLVASGVMYWAVFNFVVPRLRSGRVLTVRRDPIILMDDEGDFVQSGELVEQSWEVPARLPNLQF